MSADNEPGVSEDLKRIHSVITRAIAVSIVYSREYLKRAFPTRLSRKVLLTISRVLCHC